MTFIIRVWKAARKKTIDAAGFINYTPSPVFPFCRGSCRRPPPLRSSSSSSPLLFLRRAAPSHDTIQRFCQSVKAKVVRIARYYIRSEDIILITSLTVDDDDDDDDDGVFEERKWKTSGVDDGKQKEKGRGTEVLSFEGCRLGAIDGFPRGEKKVY